MTATLLPASTRKRLFLAHRRDGAGESEEPHFPDQAVYAEAIHARHPGGPWLLASGDSAHWLATIAAKSRSARDLRALAVRRGRHPARPHSRGASRRAAPYGR